MNDPSAQPIDGDEQRAWLLEHKKATGLSWKQLGGRVGVAFQSIQLWTSGNYNGPGERFAEAVFRYRQTLAAQAALKGEIPEIPPYFETETSTALIYRLSWAQRGRIVACALSPGLGKSITGEHYRACNSNVFLATMSPAQASVTSMQYAVLENLGNPSFMGRPDAVSRMIRDRVRDLGNPLLIVDEAQHLTEKAIDEIRSWHDDTGLGVALLGNATLLQTLEGRGRSIARAQLFSRISLKLVRTHALTADVDALLDAWRLSDPKICEYVHIIAQKPGALRGTTFTLELAHMIAASAGEELAVTHIQDAWAQLSTQPVAA